MILLPPRSTLFPYTTLFLSLNHSRRRSRRSGRCALTGDFVPAFTSGYRDDVGRFARMPIVAAPARHRSEEHTSELQSRQYLVCRLLLEKKHKNTKHTHTLHH